GHLRRSPALLLLRRQQGRRHQRSGAQRQRRQVVARRPQRKADHHERAGGLVVGRERMVVTATTPHAGAPVAPPARPGLRPLSPWSFAAVAVVSFGGPLALAALYGPQAVGDLSSGGGLAALAAPVIFVLPLWIWLRYARQVHRPDGLAGFVRAAAGRRVATVQAAVWTVSYLLYLLYTTAYVVYDVLPAVSNRVGPYRSTLEVLLPVAL